MAKKVKARIWKKGAKPIIKNISGVDVAYGTKSISMADLPEYRKLSDEELYFPIVIRMVDTQEIKLIKGIYGMPTGVAFVILKTNEDR